jgi:hypothetical protein
MFIQSAFIRKNSPYLQEKLKEMGYKTDSTSVDTKCIATSSTHNSFTVIAESRFDSTNPHVTWNNGNRIDCGDNENLFLAIAALRDDSDYMQWFTDGEKWIQNKQNDIEVIKYGPGNPINFHKATINELIEHFK